MATPMNWLLVILAVPFWLILLALAYAVGGLMVLLVADRVSRGRS